MGLSHSPSIVTSNLILALDAANPKSYPGSGNTWFDITGRGNNGTLINGPSYSSNSGGFISCDGVNDYIEILDNSIFDFGSNNFSVEHWFRKNATSSNSNYWGVNKWNSAGPGAGTNEWFVTLGNSSSGIGESIQFGIESGSTLYEMVIPNTPTLYLWNQVVAIRSGAGLSVYLNGAMIGSSSPSGMASNTSVNNISGRNIRIANSALNNYYNKCDSSIVRIYRQALSADEVKQNYDATKKRYEYDVPIVTDGLILNLDAGNLLSYAGSGNSWVDVSKNNNTGLLVNGPTYSGSGVTGALVFDGTNDYVTLGKDILSTVYTISAWFMLGDQASNRMQIIFDSSYSGILMNKGGGEFYYKNVSSYLLNFSYSFNFNTWYNITAVNASNKKSIYINGSLVASIFDNSSYEPVNNFVIGSNAGSVEFLLGKVAEVIAYNRALRSSEIYQNFNAMRSRYGL
jgi:hypothetical protein